MKRKNNERVGAMCALLLLACDAGSHSGLPVVSAHTTESASPDSLGGNPPDGTANASAVGVSGGGGASASTEATSSMGAAPSVEMGPQPSDGGAAGGMASGGPSSGGGAGHGGQSSFGGAGAGYGGANAGAPGEEGENGGTGAQGGNESEPRPVVVAAPGTELVRIDTELTYQTFEGWGTSLCWWANHVGGWGEDARNAVVDAVVNPVSGLGYNVFRYNIGGGENPAHEHMQEHREMPGFQASDGTWDWDADANQRAILLAIAERGSDLIFEAFSNSPPYWMTESGCASGSNDGSDNLRDDSYGAFADYLTEVVLHYRDTYGIVFRTLEPLNEPYADWWRSNGSQEGCHFSPSNQQRIIRSVAEQLVSKGLSGTNVSASDENSMDDAVRNVGAFDEATLAALTQLNVHSYAGSRRRELRELADQLGKRLWQSESGPLGQNISDDLEVALFMADRIITDLRELRPEAWLDWQSGDPSRSWASFTLDNDQESYRPLKRFYMHAGFSRFIRPGAILVDVDHSSMVAALSKERDSLALVVLNRGGAGSRRFTVDLTALPSVAGTVEGYRTSASEDLLPLESIAVEEYRFIAEVPADSVTTFVVRL